MNAEANITTLRRPLRVLFVEDSETDALLLLRALQRAGFEPDHRRVDCARGMDEALRERDWDIILADHHMPQFSAPEALEILKQHGVDLPFIIVSGHIEEETAVRAMMAGAHDYIMKDRLARLAPAVIRELREAEVRRQCKEIETALRRAQEELELRVEERTAVLRDTNQKLQQVIQDRQRLENELLEIAESERKRIGLDLHDDLGQKLTGISMIVKGLEQQLAAEKHPLVANAAKIGALLQEVTNRTHDLASEFTTVTAERKDLVSALRQLVASVERLFGIKCSLEDHSHTSALPEHAVVHIYKICQEAVSNAIKHGRAGNITIRLSNEGKVLRIAIENDGAPFSTVGKKHRLGLRIMQYRASSIGATLEIESLEGLGTAVVCTVQTDTVVKSTLKRAVRSPAHAFGS